MEEWREYMNTGYWVSNMGNVMNKNGKHLKPCFDCDKYLQIGINQKTTKIHKLVAHCFIGEKPNGLQIDHINRNKIDNRVENLRYVTPSENNKNRNVYRNDISEQDPKIRQRIIKIDTEIRAGKLKQPREYYIERLYKRLNLHH